MRHSHKAAHAECDIIIIIIIIRDSFRLGVKVKLGDLFSLRV